MRAIPSALGDLAYRLAPFGATAVTRLAVFLASRLVIEVAVLAVLAYYHLMPWDLVPLVAAMAERVRP